MLHLLGGKMKVKLVRVPDNTRPCDKCIYYSLENNNCPTDKEEICCQADDEIGYDDRKTFIFVEDRCLPGVKT